MNRGWLRLGCALALGGCTLNPGTPPVQVEIPAAYRATPQTAAGAWPSAEWWTGFNSPELDALIAQARAGSLDLLAAIARVRQADAQLRISGAPLLPAVNASATDSWSRSYGLKSLKGGGYTESRSVSVGPSISYQLDFWGGLRATQASAEASARFSRFDQQTVALTVVTAVASTWFQALALQDRIDVANRNLGDADTILSAIRAREEVGTASLLDVSQQEALVAGIRAEIPGLQSQLAQQLLGLGILVGLPPEAITVRPGTLTALSLPPAAADVPSALLARRPDIAAAEAQLDAARANIQVARADFFPQVNLTAAGGWQNVGLAALFGPSSLFANAAASAGQAIFDNGQRAGALELSRGKYDELLADYRKAVLQAFTDVDNGISAYRLATEQEVLQLAAVQVAQRAADIARAQVLAGTSDIVTALQAQTTLFTDLDTLAQVRLARFQALLSLYKALGGGWAKSDVTQPASTIYHGSI